MPNRGVMEEPPPPYSEETPTKKRASDTDEPSDESSAGPSGSNSGSEDAARRTASPSAQPKSSAPEKDSETATVSAGGGIMNTLPEPSILYVTLKRSGNNDRDFRTLTRLHTLLQRETGEDEFVVVLEGGDKGKIELAFPNERTQYTPSLREEIASLVGSDNLRVDTGTRLSL